MTMTCPSSSVLRRLLVDVAFEQTHGDVAEHLSDCVRCQRSLENLAADDGAWHDMADALVAEPPRIPAKLRESLAGLDLRLPATSSDDASGRKLLRAIIIVWIMAGVMGALALVTLGWALTVRWPNETPVPPPVVVEEPLPPTLEKKRPRPGDPDGPPRFGDGPGSIPFRKPGPPDGEPRLRPKRPM